jgi:hypothetical protein
MAGSGYRKLPVEIRKAKKLKSDETIVSRITSFSSVGGTLWDVQLLAEHSVLAKTQQCIEGGEDAKR